MQHRQAENTHFIAQQAPEMMNFRTETWEYLFAKLFLIACLINCPFLYNCSQYNDTVLNVHIVLIFLTIDHEC